MQVARFSGQLVDEGAAEAMAMLLQRVSQEAEHLEDEYQKAVKVRVCVCGEGGGNAAAGREERRRLHKPSAGVRGLGKADCCKSMQR